MGIPLVIRGFQFTQFNREFEPHISKLFNQALYFNNKLDLREIILLDSQSTNVFLIARHFYLVGHYHSTTIALESRAASGLLSLCYQCLVAEKNHCGLTVQKFL